MAGEVCDWILSDLVRLMAEHSHLHINLFNKKGIC